MYAAYLTYEGGSIELPERGLDCAEGVYIDSDAGGIEGWHSAPDTKVTLTERGAGNGAHAVDAPRILYSARTVTVHLHAMAGSRDAVLGLMAGLGRAMGVPVRLRVVDGEEDTWADGYARVEWDSEREGGGEPWQFGTLTVVCPDPRRRSSVARTAVLEPAARSRGGLSYGPSALGLAYDLSYGEVGSARNVGTVRNDGTATAYPTITVTGPMPSGVRVDCGPLSLVYPQPITGVPLVLDCLSRTASVGGVDVTRNLTSRGFPSVPAGGSATLVVLSTGGGLVSVESRDTYI